MSIALNDSMVKSATLDASNAQVLQLDGAAIQPTWVVLSGTGTAVTAYVELGGDLTDGAATGSTGGIKLDRAVPADGAVWVWIGGQEVALSGSGATAVVVQAIP
jgi:hypothetical protein